VMQQYTSSSPEATREFARKLASFLIVGDVVLLQGDLGAGKTEFVKGLADGLKVKERVTSPTFTLMNLYQGTMPVYHFDLYRLDDSEDLANIGFDEFIGGDGVAVIEWPDLFPTEMPDEYVKVELLPGKKTTERSLQIEIKGNRYARRIEGSDLA
ncbi:MAG TPA: tRNA (adenosine(37)-N6)-threonylcarbamoyltransferase complex ATPase subunit type 1 TsaE, partial [Negativicutes bacterium]|nr:tRNA (adenosine(37)-N6)-threonylcarbamoyltransferase complex ATPase subunit type 1 TsaE [Negativicutes bacterium]